MPETARKFAVFTALLLVLTIGQGVRAAPGADDAGRFVKQLGDKAIEALTAGSISVADRESRFRVLLRQSFDVKRIGRFVLGRYSRKLDPAMASEYHTLFEDLIVAAYAARFAEYSGQSFFIKRVTKPKGRRDAIVLSEIRPADGGPAIRVDWQVNGNGGNYKIVDIRVEGVSMSITQRDEFTAVIRRNNGNFDSLMAALRKKSANLKSH
jgi:phospholipid transport system substrate-binding protein